MTRKDWLAPLALTVGRSLLNLASQDLAAIVYLHRGHPTT